MRCWNDNIGKISLTSISKTSVGFKARISDYVDMKPSEAINRHFSWQGVALIAYPCHKFRKVTAKLYRELYNFVVFNKNPGSKILHVHIINCIHV